MELGEIGRSSISSLGEFSKICAVAQAVRRGVSRKGVAKNQIQKDLGTEFGDEGMHGDITVGTHVDRPTGSQASCTKKFCAGC